MSSLDAMEAAMQRLSKGQSAGVYKHIDGFKQADVKQNLTEDIQQAAQMRVEKTKASGGSFFPSFLPGQAAEDKAAKAMAAAMAVAAKVATAPPTPETTAAVTPSIPPAPPTTAVAQPTEHTRRTFSEGPADASASEPPVQRTRKRRMFSEGPPTAGPAETAKAASTVAENAPDSTTPACSDPERAARRAKRKSKWDVVGEVAPAPSPDRGLESVTAAQLSACDNPQQLKDFVEKVNQSNKEYDALQNERLQNATTQYATGNMMENEDGTGKHHFGDFIPADALAKFHRMAKGQKEPVQAPQIDMNNKGAQMMAKMGFTAGQGLGANGTGMTSAIDAGVGNALNLGIGVAKETWMPTEGDDDFDLYRKRMMLGYKHRPNPLNNPRTSYF